MSDIEESGDRDSVIEPTEEEKAAQLARWMKRVHRAKETRPLGDILADLPGDKDDPEQQRKNRIALLQDRAYLAKLFAVDFSDNARTQFEDKYGLHHADWTADVIAGEAVYRLNPDNFPEQPEDS